MPPPPPPPPGQHPLIAAIAAAAANPIGVQNVLGAAPALPDVVALDGFISGTVTQPGGVPFWLIYRDWQRFSWLLVEESGVIHSQQVTDDSAPGGLRDVVWVGPDTAVGQGAGTQSDQARFLTGEFTRAADFEASSGGDAGVASTGVFCPTTQFCCYRTTRR
jgi:hypothetical protein